MSESMPVRHDAGTHRFEVDVEGHVSTLDYTLTGQVMTITHTIVPDAVGGRGIAATLVKTALDHARAQAWKVVPACSYALAWMKRHPDYDDLRVA